MDLARNTKSIFRTIAPAEQKDVEIEWHGRTIKGRGYMRDLLDAATKNPPPLQGINSSGDDHDFAVFISNRPCGDKVTELAKKVGDPRTLFWTPANRTQAEQDRLLDFSAYRELVKDYQHKDTEDAKEVIQWVANRLRDEIGSIVKLADVLAAGTDEKLADLLAERIPADPGNAKLLAKYLKKIVVKVIHLHEFRPTKTKVEKADIESVVGEFRKFLETALDGDGAGQSTIGEIR